MLQVMLRTKLIQKIRIASWFTHNHMIAIPFRGQIHNYFTKKHIYYLGLQSPSIINILYLLLRPGYIHYHFAPLQGQLYSFIMFACFSKKKKPNPLPTKLDKLSTEPATPQQPTEESIAGPFIPPPPKPLKKSKFCPIEPTQHLQNHDQQKSTNSLMAIDRLLEEELKEEGKEELQVVRESLGQGKESSLPYGQENTAHFGELPERPPPILPTEQGPEPILDQFKMAFRDTKSQCFQMDSFQEDSEQHMIPKASLEEVHTIQELAERISGDKNRRRGRKGSSRTSHSSRLGSSFAQELKEEESRKEYIGYDATVEQWALDTTITLENFKISPQRIHHKIGEELQDSLMEETLEQAENSFYSSGTLQDEFTRATISADSPSLSKRIFSKMSPQEKNGPNFKGYTPVQLLVLKTIKNQAFLQLTKAIIYDADVSLDCRGPTGWTPIQEALFYRSIPLVTHLFKASYSKKQLHYQGALVRLARLLQEIPDFALEMEVKVDSFLPLLGSLTPNDTLFLRKQGSSLRLKYSLVGYQFPNCKRRDMEILFSGGTLWGVNLSKGTCCDLLESLEHEEMILMIEDMLTGEMRRGWPIVHSVSLSKSLSLFQNDITATLAGTLATKHCLNLCYSSTAEKRRSQITAPEELAHLGNYAQFKDKRESLTIKEKNRNKKVQLEVWLAANFGLQLPHLAEMLGVLSMGNSFIAEWSKFFKDQVGSLVQQSGLFPVKIDIPLSFSLFFNIQFKTYTPLPNAQPEISLPATVNKVSRKQFQGTLLSKEKRSLFIQAYT